MKRRIIAAIVAAALALAALLTGCGSSPVTASGAVADKSDDGEPVTILVPKGCEQSSAVETAAGAYRHAHPENEVVIEKIDPKTFDNELYTHVLSGSGPDWYIANGYLEPLEGYMESDKTMTDENFAMNIVEAGKVGLSQMVFPISYSVPSLCWYPENLEKAGFAGEAESAEEFYRRIFALDEQKSENGLKTLFASNTYAAMAYTAAGGFADLESRSTKLTECGRLALKLTYDNYLSDAERVSLWSKTDYDTETETYLGY